MCYLFLVAYWILFWRKFLINPYLLCTSEVASTFFPHWIWMGKQLRRGIFPAQDEIYYKYPGSIPFLSTFYPPYLFSAWIGSFLNQDRAFKLYAYLILSHFFLCSIFSYWLFGNLFAAITLAYAGYVIKPNTPCFVFSATWVPLVLKGGLIGGVGWGMALLGGYYPILVYVAPLILALQPLSFIIGVWMALPQLLPFLGYFKRSVRMQDKVDKNFGRVPWWKLLDFVNPVRNIGVTNGVHYPEMMMYMGIAVLFIWHLSWWWYPSILSFLICVGILPAIQRIPARAIYLLTLCIVMLLIQGLPQLHNGYMPLLLFHAFLLLRNASIYPSFPFSQWWNQPSKVYTQRPKAYNWPYVTGYLEERRISEYNGAFRLVS